jgi:hypothetical protein
MNIRRAIAVIVLAICLAGCGVVDIVSNGLSYSKAVETDLEQATADTVREVVTKEFKQTPDTIVLAFSLKR